MNDWTHDTLTALHAQNQPDSQFADDLELTLRAMYISRRPAKPLWTRRVLYQLSGLAASLLILAGLFTFTPLRGLAQEILDNLFRMADSNVIGVTPSADGPEVATPSLLTLDQVRELADFTVKLPSYPLDNYQFMGAGYTASRQAVNLLYETSGRFLTITQQPLASAEEGVLTDGTLGIGAGAPVSEVAIGDHRGVFVTGMWVETEGGEATWMSSASQRRLRWVEGDMLYEVFAQGGSEGHGFIGQDAMIAIALSLQ